MSDQVIAELRNEINQLKIQLADANIRLQDYVNRETELCEREDKVLEYQLTAEYERERVNDHKEIMRYIFGIVDVEYKE